jgi:5-methylcytosine-specific restriction protein B
MATVNYYKELLKFIEVADKQITGQGTTEEATIFTRDRKKEINGLKVEVSFGKGRASGIPWISFLGNGQTTKNGIYPVYLYYKTENILILAYGVSETNIPNNKWELKNIKTISDYYAESNLGTPHKYGNSFIFKTYKINQLPSESEINNDLIELINYYTSLDFMVPSKSTAIRKSFEYKTFLKLSHDSGLKFTERNACRFASALLTKPFVILTGLSGSGKTKLAQAFAMWISESNNQYCIVPVGADWTNREPLLGFPNALLEKDYKKDEYGVLKLIIEANANSDKPYFLILDEMNLSHVERYFADFLSVMESKGKISLHSGRDAWNEVPSEIGFPKNLFIIGTVNIDETTYMFSPKVLDRANVIEFRVTKDEMENYLQSNSAINLDNLEGLGANMAGSFVEIAKDNSLEASDILELNKALMNFFLELKKTGAEFGYRSASEILRFAAVVNKIETTWSMTQIIDAAIIQKLLPKVHGSRRKLEPVLKTLGQLCLQEGQKFDDLLNAPTEIDFKDTDKIKYPISLEKILRMNENLISNGFTSYAEA